MNAAAATFIVSQTISCLRFSSSHSSSIDAAQRLSSFLFSFRRRRTPFKFTRFISSSYTPTSFPLFPVPVPISTVSHHTIVVNGVISPSASTLKFPMLCHQSSAVMNFSTASNSSGLDWAPLRVSCIIETLVFSSNPCGNELCYLVVMDTFGLEFETEQALFNYYIKTLAAVVGSDEEAKKKIYLVSCGFAYGFGAEIDEEIMGELCDQPGVTHMLKDFSYELRKSNIGDCSSVRFTPINWNHRVDDIFSYHHLSECNSAWNSDHWLVHIQSPNGEFSTKQQVIDLCIRMLTEVVGSKRDAKRKIYSVWCKMPFGFGAEIDVETLNRLKALPDVLLVLPDYAFDIKVEDEVLVVFPSSQLKSDSSYYYYYQPFQLHSLKDPEESTKEILGESVRSLAHFTLTNYNHRLDNVFAYHHWAEKNSKWNSDHWLIVIKQPECGFTTEAQTFDFLIKILAGAIGSEQEAKERIYIIWSNFPLGFGAEIDRETSNKLKDCQNVLKVLPDYAFDVMVPGGILISHSLQKSRFYYYSSDILNNVRRVHWRNPLEHPDYTDDCTLDDSTSDESDENTSTDDCTLDDSTSDESDENTST